VNAVQTTEPENDSGQIIGQIALDRGFVSEVWLTPTRLAFFIGFVLCARFPGILLGTQSFFDRDFGLFTYPAAHWMRQSFWRGEIPLWNPFNNCGIPFLAQWNTSVCYPFSMVYVLFPLPWSLNLFCLGHLILAGIGMYFLAQRWTGNRFAAGLAGVAYALNGLSLNSLMWVSNLAAMAWLPVVVLAGERAWREGGRRIGLASTCSALQMLTGSPEFILVTWVLLGTLWFSQRWQQHIPAVSALRLGAVAALTFLLSAAQLLPFIELLRVSGRVVGQNGGVWSLPAWGWGNLVLPLFRCSPTILGSYIQPEQQWISSYYVGVAVVSLALGTALRPTKRRTWWLVGVGILGLLLALGEHGFLYGALKHLLPIVGLVRYPVKFILFTVFALPLLAALGLASAKQPGVSFSVAKEVVRPSLFVLALMIAIAAAGRFFPYPQESWHSTCQNGLERGLFLILMVGALLLWIRAPAGRKCVLLEFLCLLLLAADLLSHMPGQNPLVSTEAYTTALSGQSLRTRVGESRAMIHPMMNDLLQHASTPKASDYTVGIRRAQFCNCNLLEDVAKVDGFYSLYLRHEEELRKHLSSLTNLPTGLLDFLAVTHLSSPDVLFEWNLRNSKVSWVSSGQRPICASDPDALKAITAADFDPRRIVYLPIEAREAISATNAATAEVLGADFGIQTVDLRVRAEAPTWVVVAQANYPAWRAYVDGKNTPIWRANYAFQALEVPEGTHRVQLRFEDRPFRIGCAVSGLGLLLSFGIWYLPVFKVAPSPPPW